MNIYMSHAYKVASMHVAFVYRTKPRRYIVIYLNTSFHMPNKPHAICRKSNKPHPPCLRNPACHISATGHSLMSETICQCYIPSASGMCHMPHIYRARYFLPSTCLQCHRLKCYMPIVTHLDALRHIYIE